MRAPQNTNRIQTYKSYTHKVVSRTPLPVGSYNSSTVKVRGVSNLNNLNTYNNMTLKNRSIFDSLNIEKRNYVYVEQVPNSNVIYYDSNLKKYRTLSETLKNPSNAKNSLNLSNQRNFLDKNKTVNINKAITQNNRYNQTKNCICDHYQVVKPSELEKVKNERMNRTAISTNVKSNINMSQTIRSNRNQTSSSRNQAVLLNENQYKRYHSQTNKVESKRELGGIKNNNEENNQKKRGNTNIETRNNRQSNQVNKRDDKEKNKNKNENSSIPIPQKGKVYQEDIVSGRKKENKDINANNTNINANANKINSSDNKKLEKPANYAPIPINKSKEKEKEKEQINTNKKLKNLPEVDIQQLEKNQSPYKNEEIVKDENGEIIKKKEEKTIVILPGQTIEPKSVIETFEKPIIEVVQNEDGTSQSVFKQTKIITTMENIPINNSNNSGNNGDGDLQLIKQIITYEYKTVSTAKDKLEKSDNKNKEENKENNLDNINDEKNEEKAEGKEENNNDMNDKKDKTNLRYMDLEKEENSQKEDLIKENENNEKENKKQTDIKKDTKDKNKNKDFNLKAKNKNVSKNEQKTQNKNVKEETDSKSKNIKSGSTEQKSTKNEKSKIEKEKGKNLKEKSENESTKKKSDSSKAKDKKDINKEKASKESTNKELTSNNKKGKNNEETNLGKPLKKNKKEEKDAKKSESSGDYKIVFELYEKCFKLGNKPGSEKDLGKIVEILIVLEEKERKDILSKLLKAFPKSSELNQKIIILINKKISKSNDKNKNKDNQKGKEKGGKLSLEKETAKESRSKSQMKQGVKKNNLKAEEGAIKSEINKKLKLGGENSIKSPSKNTNISPLKLESHSVNATNIGNLNFDGLFMDISKYQSNARYENPFRGPSSFYKFYKIRQTKIKKKLNEMTNEAKNNSEDKKDSQK